MTLLAHTFGINHAAVTTPILYQSTYLGAHLGNVDNALLYGVTMLTSLFIAPLTADFIGPRVGLTLSMCGYAAYVSLFAAALVCDVGALMNSLAIAGAIIGGLAAGILWTFQGVLVGNICSDIARSEGKDAKIVSSDLMATFGWWFLIWEAVMRATTTGLLKLGVAPAGIFFSFGGLSALASLAFLVWTPADAATTEKARNGSLCGKVSKAVVLWRDPKILLLQFTNLTFGFGAAWNASYVGPNFTAKAISAEYIGFTGAVISLLGGFGSKLLGYIVIKTGKAAILFVGSLSFLAIGVLSMLLKDGSGMGYSVLIFPALMGLGRAVYESTNKGVFLDVYPSPEMHPAVFGNVMMFGTLSSTIVFVLGSLGASNSVIYLLIVCAVCTFPGMSAATCMKAKEDAGKELADPLARAC
jgi:hypothetical protein